MTRFSPFSDSLWYATATPASPWPELTQDIDSEVCVVGGGYTGLTTALALARRGVSVSLLEAEEIGFGGSGRNAGHCTPTFTQYSLPALRRMLGEPWATRLIDRQTKANRTVSHLVERYAIACDWIQNGYVMGALMPGQLAALRQKQRDYNAVGAETAMLSAEAIAEKTGSERFAGVGITPKAGTFNRSATLAVWPTLPHRRGFDPRALAGHRLRGHAGWLARAHVQGQRTCTQGRIRDGCLHRRRLARAGAQLSDHARVRCRDGAACRQPPPTGPSRQHDDA